MGGLMPPEDEHRVEVHLDEVLVARGLTLSELADRAALLALRPLRAQRG
jgi:hypothetical protein